MRSVDVSIVSRNIKEMCIQANHFLSEDMDIAMKNAVETEEAPLGKQILTQLQENLKIAGEDMIPICQDTGMAVVFIEVGQEVHFSISSVSLSLKILRFPFFNSSRISTVYTFGITCLVARFFNSSIVQLPPWHQENASTEGVAEPSTTLACSICARRIAVSLA